MDVEKRQNATTTDGKVPRPGFENASAPAPIDPTTGQHGAYWILSDAERAKGFVRPVRQQYIHTDGCGGTTTMILAIAETYAAKPDYYGSTFCTVCKEHFPVSEFQWDDSNEVVGS